MIMVSGHWSTTSTARKGCGTSPGGGFLASVESRLSEAQIIVAD